MSPPCPFPNRASLSSTADPQASSPLFSTLPAEIRQQIYLSCWRSEGTSQHVMMGGHGASHTACIVDQRTPDMRIDTACEWGAHLKCIRSLPLPPRCSSFLPLLLACKRTYLECSASQLEHLTFVFNDPSAATAFLTCRRGVRFVELNYRVPTIVMDRYEELGGEEEEEYHTGRDDSGGAADRLPADNNPWERACASLAEMPRLQRCSVWLDLAGQRPWREVVDEVRFLAGLWRVRAGDFVVMLPETAAGMEEEVLRAGERRILAGKTLEGALFVVERGRRPLDWTAQLVRGNCFLDDLGVLLRSRIEFGPIPPNGGHRS